MCPHLGYKYVPCEIGIISVVGFSHIVEHEYGEDRGAIQSVSVSLESLVQGRSSPYLTLDANSPLSIQRRFGGN